VLSVRVELGEDHQKFTEVYTILNDTDLT